MTVESSLNYQRSFFNDFADAWAKRSTFKLYQGIDKTASTLRLEVSETPGYILAYDKGAQDELRTFLQKAFVVFLREHVPFFEVSDDGRVFFGDWYHRRQFGVLSIFTRTIDQTTAEERNIMPQLNAFAQDPDHYLDNQLEALRKDIYRGVNDLHNQLEAAEVEAPAQPTRTTTSGGSLRGLLKNFIDPDDEEEDTPMPSQPTRRRSQAPADLKQRFDAAKAAADAEFDAKKRAMQVSAAITRYEYQAVIGTYSSITQFENILANLQDDFMRALEVKEEN